MRCAGPTAGGPKINLARAPLNMHLDPPPPPQVDLTTLVSRNVPLRIPIVSSPMDTVTETEMAVAMATVSSRGAPCGGGRAARCWCCRRRPQRKPRDGSQPAAAVACAPSSCLAQHR